MKLENFLNNTAVFTLEDFRSVYAGASDYALLVRAVKSGRVRRVSNGIFVSNFGRFEKEPVDPYVLASKIVPDAVFSYHSALALNGVAHSVMNRVQFRTTRARKLAGFKPYSFESFRFGANESPRKQKVISRQYPEVWVTTPEQTLVDCVKYPARAGGSEEMLRSLSGFSGFDFEAVRSLACGIPKATAARLGWLLDMNQDEWRVPDSLLCYLGELKGGNTYYFASSGAGRVSGGWSGTWRLVLPTEEAEMRTWR